VLKDIFHLMDMIRVPKDHTLKKEFTRRLRDALFVPDKDDMARIERYLRSQGKTWEGKLDEDADWILRRTKRVVPKESVLLPVVERLFEEYAALRCASTDRPLFDEENWRQVEQVKKAIRSGEVSDPPGMSFYFLLGHDGNGLPLYRCSRGTNSIEGGVHQNIIRKFGSFNAGPQLADCTLADYRLHHNIDVSDHNKNIC
jgi:hypothetical protein